MWVLFYAMAGGLFAAPAMNTVGPMPTRDACDHVRVQIDSAFHPKISACIEMQFTVAPAAHQ